jgi:hypothetical protein
MRPAGRSPGIRHDDGRKPEPAWPPLALTTSPRQTDAKSSEPRSGLGSIPGAEFPAFVYVSVLLAFAWIMLASWLAFAGDMDAALALGIAIVLAIVFFALPIIIRHVAVAFSHNKPETTGDFLSAPVDTATGPLSGASAWLQVLLIPLALALAATLIGTAYLLVR